MKPGWQTKKLGDVATLQRGFDLPTHQRVGGDVPLVTSSGVTDTHIESAVRGPGVATGRSGSIGNVFFIEGDFWPLNTVLYVRNFHGNDPRFVFHLLRHFDLKRFATGAGVPTLNRNFVHDEIVSIPPLAEQRRIVAVLDEAFAGFAIAKANAERNLRNARALFESHVDSAFSTAAPGSRRITLGEATGGVFTGPFGSLLHKADYIRGGVPLVNPANITDTGIEPDHRKTVSEATAERLAAYVMREGDIVVGRRGEMGRCAVVTRQEDAWLCGTGSFFIRSSPGCDPHYLVLLLRSAAVRKRLEKLAGGAVMPNLTNTALAGIEVYLPPVETQRAVVERAKSIAADSEGLRSVYRAKLDALEALKKSLLHQAFTGNLP